MSCCAIIVTFYPSKDITENIAALSGQVDQIVVVDNGSGDSNKELLERLTQQSGVSIIFNYENLGIAAALNIGIKKAKTDGHQWAVTFDQDSQATPHMIESMLKAYDAYPQKEKVASLSPRYKNKDNGEIISSTFTPQSWDSLPYVETLEVMTSGNLIKLGIFDTVGYFNEALFIDSVDIEHCLRCVSQGYKILEVKNAILLHKAGFPSRHKLLWKRLITSNHTPLRRYYIARNSIYTYKKFIFKQPIWVAISFCKFLKSLVTLTLFENDRKKKLSAIFLGFLDGFWGRMGKCTRRQLL